MNPLLEPGIVRIYAFNDTIVGAGLLISRRLVLSCAHVVTCALGISNKTASLTKSPMHPLSADIPLINPEYTLKMQVIHWQPKKDIAVLKINDDLPKGAQPVRLIITDDLWNHTFRVFGFPDGYESGLWTSGQMLERNANGWVQIEDVKVTGHRVEPGFSGAPVWDEQSKGVAGMIVASDANPKVKTGFIIPTKMLIEAWPILAEWSLDAGSLDHLHYHLAQLKSARQNILNPSRLDSRIKILEEKIATWEGRIERQQLRITKGLAEQRQHMAKEQARRNERRHFKTIGQPPLQVSGYFKNRERESSNVRAFLAEPTTRLVSVLGHGGMGKTALVCKVLRDIEQGRWPCTTSSIDNEVPFDGILYLSTRTAGISLERIFLESAKLLDDKKQEQLNSVWTNPQLKTEDKVTQLLNALSNRRYVILMDNLEDLLNDHGKFVDQDLRLFFEKSLTIAHGAKLVVTSRVALAFRREVMRFDRQVKLLEGLPIKDGVALLQEMDPNADYGLRDMPEEKLSKVVGLMHGVPRALEVFVGILANDPFVTVDEVIENFYEHKDVVQALIEENYRHLDKGARQVIDALAVFRRPVPLLAIDYLLAPFAPGLDVPSVVKRMTRTNIVSVDRSAKTVTLHPIDQDYAYSQLPEKGIIESTYTRQALERRAADYFLQLRTPPEKWKSIEDLEPQLNEFEHRIRAGDYDDACQVLNKIDSDYLYLWGHYNRLVEMRKRILGKLSLKNLQAANLDQLGRAYYSLGKFERAIELYKDALTITRRLGDYQQEGVQLGHLGRAYRALGHLKQALRYYKQAWNAARETNDQINEGIWIGHMGIAYRNLGYIDKSIACYKQALTLARETNDLWQKGMWLGNLGISYWDLGQFDQAMKLCKQGLDIAQEIGDRRETAYRLLGLGNVYRELGKSRQAIYLYRKALPLFREIGNQWGEEVLIGHMAIANYYLQNTERAIKLHTDALTLAKKTGDKRGQSRQMIGLSRILLAQREISKAYQFCTEALKLDVPETSYQAALILGIIMLHQHSQEEASRMFENAINLCQSILEKSEGLYKAQYALAASMIGQTISTSHWMKKDNHTTDLILASALEEYQRALEITAAPSVVRNAICDINMIQATGVKGLEPVLELLENAE